MTGVEARPHLVQNARETFAHYGADPASYDLVCQDVFHYLRGDPPKVDVVLCLTKRKPPVIALVADKTRVEANAVTDDFSTRDRVLVGFPSSSALQMMLNTYGYRLDRSYDWNALVRRSGSRRAVKDHSSGRRVTVRFRLRRGPS